MVGIGVVGIGFMGLIHTLAIRRGSRARLAAVCTRDARKRAGDWRGIKGNFGPPGEVIDLAGVGAYADPAELFADPAVDLVDLCVPTDQHPDLAIRALEAGKHVLVEKPIALELADADRMMAAARASGRLLMVAHVLPFFPEFGRALAAVRSGEYGRLLGAHLHRVIARPAWSEGIADAERSGGPAIDLHIHDAHFVGLLCGRPRRVRSIGVEGDGGGVVHLATHYLFDGDGPAVSATSGAIGMPGMPFGHGFEVYLERATLTFRYASVGGRDASSPLAIAREDGSVDWPDLGPADPVDAFVREVDAAASAVESGRVDPILDGGAARDALATCRAEVESVRSGSAVDVA